MTAALCRLIAFSFLPVPLLLAACLWGGAWSLGALVYTALITATLDQLLARETPPGLRGGSARVADAYSAFLALCHFGLMALTLWAVPRQGWTGALTFAAAGLFFGQISIPNAHELIHRPGRVLRALGIGVYTSVLFGHHNSAHRLVHHVHVATPQDPNSARYGESYWHFVPRAWIGSFRAGLAAENARKHTPMRHPYSWYIAGGVLCVIAVLALLGLKSLAVYGVLCLHIIGQLLMSDYVQHYGLRRRVLPNGRPEPAGPLHSWDSPHVVSSAMMLNAPRHADHHAHPMRRYPDLELSEEGATLPYSLPAMGMLALLPDAWRAVMNPRVAELQNKLP